MSASQQPTANRQQPARRIAVIGTSGSGKTTFSRRIATSIGAPHVELDGLFHEPNWTPAEPDVFRARVSAAIAAPSWVTDGNYSTVLRDLIWRSADVIVWLDYPFRIVIWRLFLRTMRRGVRREELWNGNHESLREHFFTRQSLFLWAKNTHWKHRRDWPAALASPEMARVRLVRLRTPREAEVWLRRLTPDSPTS
jgi:adenylate kinase family enzyme